MKNLTKILSSVVLMFLASAIFSVAFTDSHTIQPAALLTGSAVLFGTGFGKGLVFPNFTMPRFNLYDGFVITDTTYAGEAASTFIVKAITGNETVDGGHVYVKDGIKKKFTIPRFDADFEDFVQDRAATPVSKGTLNVDGRALTPQDYMIYTEFNPRDYEDHWFATQLNPTLIDRTLPVTVESTVVQEVLKRHSRYLNKALWNSDSTLASPSIYRYYDGFIKKAADAASNVVSSPTTLTASNIQGEMLRCWNLIPAALRYNTDMKFFVNYATYDLYITSQINQTYKGVDVTSEGKDTFKGRKVVKINDLPDNFIFVAKGSATMESNLWVGMNSTDDAKLELRQLQANSELWFIKMLMKVDVQIGWTEETVLYKA